MMACKMQTIQSICQRFDVAVMYLFGSQCAPAKKILGGELLYISDPLTDIDVGVVFTSALPKGLVRVRLYSRLYNELEDLFAPYKLDLVFLEENHSVFQAEAVKGICIYTVDATIQETYEEDILRRACDFRPFLEKYYNELLEVSQNGQ